MSSAQPSREATSAPAAFAKRSDPLELPAREQAVAQRAAECVAGAEPVHDVDLDRGDGGDLAAARAAHAFWPSFSIASSIGAGGSPSTAHSSRLPTSTVASAAASR